MMTSPENGKHRSPAAGKSRKSKFNSIMSKWKESDDGSAPFEAAKPWKESDYGGAPFEAAKPRKNGKSKENNEMAIRDYKQKIEAKVPFHKKSKGKPSHLKNIFGSKLGDENSLDYKPPVYKKTADVVLMIHKTITKNFFFDDMDSNDLPVFIDAFEPFKVEEGKHIITQGDRGDYFYIVGKNSKVAFEVNGKKVGEACEGGTFGELALLYACPRAASVVAVSPRTKLYRVGKKAFQALLQKQTKQKEAEKMKLLQAVDFLSDISNFDLTRLGRAMTLNTFGPGDRLVRKGDEGDAFYVVHEGVVSVTEISVGSTKFDDITLEPGAYFGERSLVTNEPRAANVIGKTKGSVFRIDRKTFERVLGKFSRVIMKSQDRRVLEGIEIFQNCRLEPKQFEALSNLIVDKKYKAGRTIFDVRRRTNAALYVVREGSAEVSGNRSDVIKPGAYFGHDLLLLDMQQEGVYGNCVSTKTLPNYVVTAKEDCLCGVLSLSDCRTVFDTTKMAGNAGSIEELYSEELGPDGDTSDAFHLDDAPALERESTERWLTRASKDGLRQAVKGNVTLERLNRHNVLGEGQFGEVWLASAHVSASYGQQHFALKIQKKSDPARGDSVAAIKREIDILGMLDHPFIVNLVHFYEDPENLNILMGLVNGGELFDVIHTENDDGTWSSGIPEGDAKFYAMIVADTLDYIHVNQFVYRDLKPENILIDKDGYPIICDFGFAKYVEDKTYTLCGTPNYLSPEVIMNRGHGAASDHWALGVLIYEMVAGENPFFYEGMPQMELFQCIVREKFYPLPDEISDDCFYVVDELLEKDPNQRLGSLAGGMKDLNGKKWFAELNLDDLRQKKYDAPFKPNTKTLDALIERSSMSSLPALDSESDISPPNSPPRQFASPIFGKSPVTSSSLLDDSDKEQ